MPTPAITLLPPTQPLAPPAKLKASKPTDFDSQLKDAQDTKRKSRPEKSSNKKPPPREAANTSVASGGKKAKSAAKSATKASDSSENSEETEPTETAEARPAGDESDSASQEQPEKEETAKPQASDESGDPDAAQQAASAALALPTPPASILSLRNERITEARSISPVATPDNGAAKVETPGGTAQKTATDTKATTPAESTKVETNPKAATVSALPDGDDQPVAAPKAKSIAVAPAAPPNTDASSTSSTVDPSTVSTVPPEISSAIDSADAVTNVANLLSAPATAPRLTVKESVTLADATPSSPRETEFAETNHASIVSEVRSTLLPQGGSMQIRLDPPELGALQVNVEVRNGVVNATFQTSNDDATRLLGHSLGQLKTALESQGVTVDKIQVQQTPRDEKSSGDSSQQQQRDNSEGRQEQQRDQQRREMLQRMWQQISGAPMPVDLVA